MNYNNHLIARTEHESRANTLRTPHEFDFQISAPTNENRYGPLLQLWLVLTALINLITR